MRLAVSSLSWIVANIVLSAGSIEDVPTIKLVESSTPHPMSAFSACEGHQPLTNEDETKFQNERILGRHKKGFCLNITMDLLHLLEDLQQNNESFQDGLSYAIVEVSSIFHFDAGFSLNDDVFLLVRWRLLFQWFKYGFGDVLGPFLGPLSGRQPGDIDAACPIESFSGSIGADGSDSGVIIDHIVSSSFQVARQPPRSRRSEEREKTNAIGVERVASIHSGEDIGATFECSVGSVGDSATSDSSSASNASTSSKATSLRPIHLVLKMNKKCVAELGNFTFISNYSVLRSQPEALFSKTIDTNHEHKFYVVHHDKNHSQREIEKWCYPPTTTTTTRTTMTTTTTTTSKPLLKDDEAAEREKTTSGDQNANAWKIPIESKSKIPTETKSKFSSSTIVALFVVFILTVVISVGGVSYVRQQVLHRWSRMSEEDDGEDGGTRGGGNGASEERGEEVDLPNTPLQRHIVFGRTVIGYANSDWDCVIATSPPPSVSAHDPAFKQRQQQENEEDAQELRSLRLGGHSSPQPPAEPAPVRSELRESPRPLVDIDEIVPTIIIDDALRTQRQRDDADFKLLANSSAEELVEFDRLSTDVTFGGEETWGINEKKEGGEVEAKEVS